MSSDLIGNGEGVVKPNEAIAPDMVRGRRPGRGKRTPKSDASAESQGAGKGEGGGKKRWRWGKSRKDRTKVVKNSAGGEEKERAGLFGREKKKSIKGPGEKKV